MADKARVLELVDLDLVFCGTDMVRSGHGLFRWHLPNK